MAILSRLPLDETAVWPLPPSRPPRHRVEAKIVRPEGLLTLSTLQAAVSPAEHRDAQIAAKPRGEPVERRLDYLLAHDVNVLASGIVTLADERRSASDHRSSGPTWHSPDAVSIAVCGVRRTESERAEGGEQDGEDGS